MIIFLQEFGEKLKPHTLAKLVDLPTPFTPQNAMVYGLLDFLASMASLRISMRRLGDRSWTRASTRVCFTVEVIPVNVPRTFPSSLVATDSQSLSAISAATFLAKKKEKICILTTKNIYTRTNKTYTKYKKK